MFFKSLQYMKHDLFFQVKRIKWKIVGDSFSIMAIKSKHIKKWNSKTSYKISVSLRTLSFLSIYHRLTSKCCQNKNSLHGQYSQYHMHKYWSIFQIVQIRLLYVCYNDVCKCQCCQHLLILTNYENKLWKFDCASTYIW